MESSSMPLRGPLLLAVLVGPYLQQHFQLETLIKLLLVFLAFRMTFLDVKHWAITSSRHHIKKSLQRIVLDDLLASIFHPETGWIAMCVTASLGNCAMYALPTTAQQRAQLLQHALLKDDSDKAERILQSPGGIAELLPHSVQAWLHADEDGTSDSINSPMQAVESLSPVLSSSQTEPGNVNITLLSDFNSEDDDDNSSVVSSEECASPTHPPKQSSPSATTEKQHDPSTLMEILGSVLSDVTLRHMLHMLKRLPPRRHLQVTSVAAAALLCTQLRSSKRARDIAWTVFHGSVSLTGAAVLTGSLLALWTRHQLAPPVESYRSTDFHSFFFSPIHRLQMEGHKFKNAVKSVAQSERIRKVQGILAVVVLAYFGQRRRIRR